MSLRALLVAAGMVCSAQASAQAPPAAIPRTADGRPDFGGVWGSRFATTIERLPGAAALVVDDAEAKALGDSAYARLTTRGAADDPNVIWSNIHNLSRVEGEWRTSLLTVPADGKLPLTQLGQDLRATAAANAASRPDGPEARNAAERCLSGNGRAPMIVIPEDNLRQIVQTADGVMIYSESGAEVRISTFNAKPQPAPAPSLLGEAEAEWDGDELVITTTGQRGGVRPSVSGALIVRPESQVVERLRLVSRDEIFYRYTIEDQAVYSGPWSAEYMLVRKDQRIFEYDCHEGNYAMVNMLQSARASERGAATPRKAAARRVRQKR